MPETILKTFKDIEIKVNSVHPEECAPKCDHYQVHEKTGEPWCDITRTFLIEGTRTKACREG